MSGGTFRRREEVRAVGLRAGDLFPHEGLPRTIVEVAYALGAGDVIVQLDNGEELEFAKTDSVVVYRPAERHRRV